jgi:zinc protease
MSQSKTPSVPTAPISGFEFVQELGGITEYTLTSNGMRVLLAQDLSVPVAGCMVTYHVGSRNEATGYTGATHLLEHLMFKGSEKFNSAKGTGMDGLLESKGARVNATTWFDRTNYYEILPKDALHFAIEIEADRMRTAQFTAKDKESEMPIVRNEYERGENSPIQALDKAVWAAAFMAHPYHHSTIGWRSDIENVSIERLRQFYDEYYWPNNATVSIAGSFDARDVLLHIKKNFGVHSKSPHAFPVPYTEEPPQEGERRVTVRRAGTDTISISHKIPNARHEDMPALMILATILFDDKTSRLYRAFIDTALATSAFSWCAQTYDPGLFQTFITLAPTVTHEKAEKILRAEIEKLKTVPVRASELKQAKQSLRVAAAARRDGAYALLDYLNEEIATGDWTRFITLPESLQKVTVKDVQRVAKKYLTDDQSTVGWFIANKD